MEEPIRAPTDQSAVRDDELPGLAGDVVYEITMAEFAAQHLIAPLASLSPLGRNAMVEAFLLHVRNLTDFFGDDRRHDDVLAADYVAEWQQLRDDFAEAKAAYERLQKQRTWINKRLSHLTATRQREAKDTDARPVTDVLADVRVLVALFLRSLPEGRRRWFESDPQANGTAQPPPS